MSDDIKFMAKHNCYVPTYRNTFDGLEWLMFQASAGNTYDTYKDMPEILVMVRNNGNEVLYKRMSFNSDNGMINYKEIQPNQVARGKL